MKDSHYRISLDIHSTQSQVSLPVKQGDTSRKVFITLCEGGKPYHIEDDCFAVFSARKPDNTFIHNNCTIADNVIEYAFTEQTTLVNGKLDCELKLYGGDSGLITGPRFTVIVDARAVSDEEVESTVSESEHTALSELYTTANNAALNANTAATNANNAANTANNAATSAERRVADAIDDLAGELLVEKANISTAIQNAENAIIQTLAVKTATQSAKDATDQVRAETLAVKEATEAVKTATDTVRVNTNTAMLATVDVKNSTDQVRKDTLAVKNDTLAVKVETQSVKEATQSVKDATDQVRAETLAVKVATQSVKEATDQVRVDTLTVKNDALAVKSTLEGYVTTASSVINETNKVKEETEALKNEVESKVANGSNIVSNALKGSASGNPVRIDDVSPVEHTVKAKVRRKRNLIPFPYHAKSITANGVTVTVNSDGTITLNGTSTGPVGFALFVGSIPLSGKYTLSGVNNAEGESSHYLQPYINGEHQITVSSGSRTYDFNGNLTQISLFIRQGYTFNGVVVSPQFEVGTIATEYEPSIDPTTVTLTRYGASETDNPQTYNPNADGTVDGVTSLYPTTTLVTDTAVVTIEAEYNRDANKVIADLLAIISKSGSSKIAYINLLASKWQGSASPYSQVVTVEGATNRSQVDLTPSAEQLSIFHSKDLTFVTENNNGVITVYAIGQKPTNDYTIQATVTEVNV